MSNNRYKNRYHPMVILMYHSNMLAPEQIESIPRTTRNEWDKFSHQSYDGYEIVKDYVIDFDEIKNVLTKKHKKQTMRITCAISYGYKAVFSEIEKKNKLMKQNADKISFSIKRVAQYGKVKIADVCRILGLSRDWYYQHRTHKLCSISKTKKCFREYPNQLSATELLKIEKIIQLPENHGKTIVTLYYDSMKKGIIFCGKSTFYKFSKLFGYIKVRRQKSDCKKDGFKATRPFEWLHVDVTDVTTQMDGIQKVAFVKDNFSGALLHYKSTSKSAESNFIRDLLEETFCKFGLLDKSLPINIVSDGGSENKGAVLEWVERIQAPPIVRKITASSIEFPYSNSMSEITHSIFKTEFMKTKHSYDRTEHIKNLDKFMIYYNYNRFPIKHYGLTVMEVLNGQIPDKHKFTEKIKNAKIERLEKNREFKDCPILCFSK